MFFLFCCLIQSFGSAKDIVKINVLWKQWLLVAFLPFGEFQDFILKTTFTTCLLVVLWCQADISNSTTGSFPWRESPVLPHEYADLSARCGCSSELSAAVRGNERAEDSEAGLEQVTTHSALVLVSKCILPADKCSQPGLLYFFQYCHITQSQVIYSVTLLKLCYLTTI